MMEESVIAFCEQYTKNVPMLILRDRLVLHVSIVVFIPMADLAWGIWGKCPPSPPTPSFCGELSFSGKIPGQKTFKFKSSDHLI